MLPNDARSELRCGEFLSSIGIRVIFGKNETFGLEDDVSLKDLMKRYVRV